MIGRKLNPAAWSYAAIAVILLAWIPPLALLAGGLIVLIAWLNGEKIPAKAEVGQPSPFRRMRTKKTVMALRMFAYIAAGLLCLGLLVAAGGASTPLDSVKFILMTAFFTVAVFVGIHWFFQHLILSTFFEGNEDYERFRDSGGDPFWDNLPAPFNNDSHSVRYGGIEEPEYTNPHYRPEADWNYQCPHCGAKLPDDDTSHACWHCGYNWGKPPWKFGCGVCGVRVPSADATCWHCGNTPAPPPGDGTAPIDI